MWVAGGDYLASLRLGFIFARFARRRPSHHSLMEPLHMGSFSLLMLDGYGATTLMITLFMWMAGLPFCEGGGRVCTAHLLQKSAAAGGFFLLQKSAAARGFSEWMQAVD